MAASNPPPGGVPAQPLPVARTVAPPDKPAYAPREEMPDAVPVDVAPLTPALSREGERDQKALTPALSHEGEREQKALTPAVARGGERPRNAAPRPSFAAGQPSANPQSAIRNPQSTAARPIPVAARSGTLPVARPPDDDEDDADENLSRLAVRNAPPWLVSTVVHMILLIVLAVWLLPPRERSAVDLNLVYSDRLGEQLDDPSVTVGADDPTPDAQQQIVTPDLKPVEDPFAAPPDMDITLDGRTASSQLAAPAIGIALLGREHGSREALLAAYGGNKLSEDAVTLGLQWLARQQQTDGSWSLKGPYKDGASEENREAAGAMALLAFQGRGNTHKSGPFQKNVALGFKALLKSQDAQGNFFNQGRYNQWMYTQGQATIAICELYGMTKDQELREPAEKAVKFCLEAQDALGGWRYRPREDSDTSVTGWVVMALQSARMAGLDVPQQTLDKVGMYLDKAAAEGGAKYAYQIGMEPKLAMTAEGLLCRQYLGWPRDDQRLVAGADYLGHNPPTLADRDVYYWYYATQVMHHMEGEHWKNWNAVMRDLLVNSQEKEGRERGSWDPKGKHPDAWGVRNEGGRLYVTCLSLYMLEVYYRHLPIYSRLK